MKEKNFGKLEKVDLRVGWSSESSDFTPWLAKEENLRVLAEAIGLELSLEAQEKDVGPFRADILCKDNRTDSWVLIENQLERTDHTHLGQLLTYAAGLQAVTVVWIAERFTDEHRAALDWLNEKTEDGINFFGLEVELWKIGDSTPAPKFNIVCKPNEWIKTVSESKRRDDSGPEYFEYWSGVVDLLNRQKAWPSVPSAPRKGNMVLPTGWANFRLQMWRSTARQRAGVYVTCRGPNAKQDFEALLKDKDSIEREVAQPLVWDDTTDADKAYITLYLRDCDPADRKDWGRQQDFLAKGALLIYQVFASRVKELENR